MKRQRAAAAGPGGFERQFAGLDWPAISADLDAHGCAVVGPLLTPAQCEGLAASYDA